LAAVFDVVGAVDVVAFVQELKAKDGNKTATVSKHNPTYKIFLFTLFSP